MLAHTALTPTLAMDLLQWQFLALETMRVLWVFAFGACVGSLTNVLVYRMPRGMDWVSPTSRCPMCETRLTWRENIPVFGWLALGGKCRFCKSPISSEYPIVEALMGLLWVLVYLALYADQSTPLYDLFGKLQPEWAMGYSDLSLSWPLFISILCLFSCLFAATLIDARTAMIPMQLTTTPVVVALVCHGGLLAWFTWKGTWLEGAARPYFWSLAHPGPAGWGMIGASIGGVVGVVISNGLLSAGLLRRSFADFAEWEETVAKEDAAKQTEDAESQTPQETIQGWTSYPHARREMVRELAFLGPPAALAWGGSALATKLAGPWTFDSTSFQYTPTEMAPRWLCVIAGVFLGYLIGAAAVWAIRIFGTLAFNKEALGLGDVHLMGAVGAVLGWVDSVLAFFLAAFVGIAWAIIGRVASGKLKREMPYGPFLAVATLLVFFGKPLIERLLGMLVGQAGPVNLP